MNFNPIVVWDDCPEPSPTVNNRTMLSNADALRAMLTDSRGGVRRAALLTLLETHGLLPVQVQFLSQDSDVDPCEITRLWLKKTSGGRGKAELRGSALQNAAYVPNASPDTSSTNASPVQKIKARSDHQIIVDHWKFNVYSREVPAGRVSLGGNTEDGIASGKGNYLVIVEPLPLPMMTTPSTLDDVGSARIVESDPWRSVV